MPFEGAVMDAESSLSFISLAYVNQMVCVVEVDFQIDSCLSWAIKEV